MFKIGVIVESFRQKLDDGLKTAAEMGADGIQIYATSGETHFEKLQGTACASLKRKVTDCGLEISALCGDFGGHGFEVAESNPAKIENMKRVIEVALKLGTNIITTHIGVIPNSKSDPRYRIMAEACEEIGIFAEENDSVIAIETGPEPSLVLKNFINDIGLKNGLRVNFDPANLVMVHNEDIPQAVDTLGKYIVHTHAKDGINLKPVNAESLYKSFAENGIEGFHATDYIKEVPLGKGGVNFNSYLKSLLQTGYSGYLTIEREVGEQPVNDIKLAFDFLRQQIKEIEKIMETNNER